MGETVAKIFNGKKTFITTLFTIALLAIGVAVFAKPNMAMAATCPQDSYPETNILYCGLSGGTDVNQVISSFQSQYTNNNDGHGHTDIQAAYNATGASSSMVKGMNSSNTKLGTAYNNGTIVVDGRTVATNIWIGARWSQGGSAYKHIENDVYTRSYQTYFLPNTSQVPVLVHFDANGQADFAAMEPCGNMITFTPTPPPAKKLSCSLLTPQAGTTTDTTVSYSYTVKATASNTTPSSYTFNFGDSSSETINSSALQVTSSSHTYTMQTVSKTVVITAVVNGGGVSGNCSTQITIPQLPSKPQAIACISLSSSLQNNTTDTYTFAVLAKPTNTNITGYKFLFGDGTNQNVPTNSTTATSEAHKYAPGDYTATVTVMSEIGNAPDAAACKVPIHVSTPPTVTPPATPTALPNAGAGSFIGAFGVISVISGIGYYFFARRKALAA